MSLLSSFSCVSRHTVVCQRPRKREKIKMRAGTPVCYLRDRSSSHFQPIITQKLWRVFLLILHILMSPYTAPYIPNLRGITPAFLRYEPLKFVGFYSYFSSSTHQITKSRITMLLCTDFKEIWYTSSTT